MVFLSGGSKSGGFLFFCDSNYTLGSVGSCVWIRICNTNDHLTPIFSVFFLTGGIKSDGFLKVFMILMIQ